VLSADPPEEPPVVEEQHVESRAGETTYIQIATGRRSQPPDFFAFTVLDSLLSGPTSLNLFAAEVSQIRPPLYRALVERDLAVGIHALQATIDPFLYDVH
jgi:hypothetical protein